MDNQLPPTTGCNFTSREFLAHAIWGSIRWERALELATFIEMCRPRAMLEVGSFIGLSSSFYLKLLQPWNVR